jgi:hypothetical protein
MLVPRAIFAFKQHIKYLCDTNALEDLIKGVVGTERRMGDVKKPPK